MIVHSFIYSIKLEIEFFILNQLVAISSLAAVSLASFSPDVEAPLPDPVAAPASATTASSPQAKDNNSPQVDFDLALAP
jgi:hypothetical protein